MLDLSRPVQCTTSLEVELLAALVEARKQLSRYKPVPLAKPKPKPRPLELAPEPAPPPDPEPEPPRSAFMAGIKEIQTAVADRFGLPVEEMLSDHRQYRIVKARHTAVLLCYILTPHSYPFLSRFFGGRDHSTLLNSVKKMRPIHEALIKELNNAAPLEAWVDLAHQKATAPRDPNDLMREDPVSTSDLVVDIAAERASYATESVT